MEDFTAYSQRHAGVQKAGRWLVVHDLGFIPRTKIAWISSWPSAPTVYLGSVEEGADILPKDLVSCWLTEGVFIIV